MFTRNYWMAQAANHVGKIKEINGGNNIKPKYITVSGSVGSNIYYLGETYPQVTSCSIDTMASVKTTDVSKNISNSSTSSLLNTGVIFGSGNEAPTIDDYKLSGSVIQNIVTNHAKNLTYNEDGSFSEASYLYTITNNNSTEITIGEVGLFSEAVWKTSNNSSTMYTHHYYMWERTALETPITIPAGGVGQVTYTIRMGYPVPPIEE